MLHVLDQKVSREIAKGFHAKFIHTDQVTIAFVSIEEGSLLPEHAHVHEQTTTVLEGRLELIIDGRSTVLEAGHAVVIPSNIRHSGIAHLPCKVMDVFCPCREDYKV